MAKNLLVTTSLLGSIKWLKDSPPNWKDRAYKSLENTLNRVWTEPNEAIKRGMDFEALVYKLIEEGKTPNDVNSSKEFKEVMGACMGGKFQVKAKSIEVIDNISYCLYGKLDVDFPTMVLDIKTTGKAPEKHNYLETMQHIMYLYLTKKAFFRYTVAVFGDKENTSKITNVCEYDYENPGHDKLKDIVHQAVRDMNEFFKDYPELYEVYTTKYSRF